MLTARNCRLISRRQASWGKKPASGKPLVKSNSAGGKLYGRGRESHQLCDFSHTAFGVREATCSATVSGFLPTKVPDPTRAVTYPLPARRS
jgi:hypothetical protein